jgi:hypothetical protein
MHPGAIRVGLFLLGLHAMPEGLAAAWTLRRRGLCLPHSFCKVVKPTIKPITFCRPRECGRLSLLRLEFRPFAFSILASRSSSPLAARRSDAVANGLRVLAACASAA